MLSRYSLFDGERITSSQCFVKVLFKNCQCLPFINNNNKNIKPQKKKSDLGDKNSKDEKSNQICI